MEDKTVLGKLKNKGEEVFSQISGELVSNPLFMKAMQRAMRAKKTFDKTATSAMSAMNLPTVHDIEKIVKRLEAIEARLDEIQALIKPKRRGRSSE